MAVDRVWRVAGRICLIAGGLCLASCAANAAEALSSGDQPLGLLAHVQGAGFVDLPPARSFPAIDEFRVGVLEPVDGPAEDKDGPPDINLELLLGRFGPQYQNVFWNNFLRPRLHFGGSISTDGGTSLVHTGLTWDVFLTQRLFVEGSFGGAIHDGDDHQFGCTVDFRESGSVGLMFGKHWELMATVDHMSNADLCDENRGLTTVGLRLGRKL